MGSGGAGGAPGRGEAEVAVRGARPRPGERASGAQAAEAREGEAPLTPAGGLGC